jgi:hypothetical protein
MLDVHAPHDAAHTWKDFWIHLGTISIGLLIAIGLEQSVEAGHRLHERHRLEQDLQMEAKKNLILMDLDNQYYDATRPWLIELRAKVEMMRVNGGKTNGDYVVAPKTRGFWWSDTPYWDTAKESAEVGLLPRGEAGMYNLVYEQQGVMKDGLFGYASVMDKMRQFESRFANIEVGAPVSTVQRVGDLYSDAPIPDLSKMTQEELREYSVLLNDALSELSRFHNLTNLAYGVTRAVTLGAMSDEQLLQLMGGRPEEKSSAENLTVH